VLGIRECAPTPPSFTVFYLGSHLSPSRSWECVNLQPRLGVVLLYPLLPPAGRCQSSKAPLKKEHLRSERCAQLKLELPWNITEEKKVVHPFQTIGMKVLTKLDH